MAQVGLNQEHVHHNSGALTTQTRCRQKSINKRYKIVLTFPFQN